jgi:hypothetical protein
LVEKRQKFVGNEALIVSTIFAQECGKISLVLLMLGSSACNACMYLKFGFWSKVGPKKITKYACT